MQRDCTRSIANAHDKGALRAAHRHSVACLHGFCVCVLAEVHTAGAAGAARCVRVIPSTCEPGAWSACQTDSTRLHSNCRQNCEWQWTHRSSLQLCDRPVEALRAGAVRRVRSARGPRRRALLRDQAARESPAPVRAFAVQSHRIRPPGLGRADPHTISIPSMSASRRPAPNTETIDIPQNKNLCGLAALRRLGHVGLLHTRAVRAISSRSSQRVGASANCTRSPCALCPALSCAPSSQPASFAVGRLPQCQ